MSCAPNATFPKNEKFARGRNSTQHNIWSEYKQLTSGWIPGFCVFLVSAMTLPTDVLCDMVYPEPIRSTLSGFGIDHIAQNISRKRHSAHKKKHKSLEPTQRLTVCILTK